MLTRKSISIESLTHHHIRMHYLLIYHTAEDFLNARAPYRAEHLQLVTAAYERGELLIGGALENPVDMALLVFKGSSAEVAEGFAQRDPYVLNGAVKRWEVRPWAVKIGG